ncbi:MAG TPA: glycosyltransferase family 61 protein [Candidatus Sulfotelmatobacter sp.]|jgi:capsular polysaccharide biosynthesis protein|nr:glycosyltransferase family 61 protein [Candidatus Sulfotelmatobacter sp.]
MSGTTQNFDVTLEINGAPFRGSPDEAIQAIIRDYLPKAPGNPEGYSYISQLLRMAGRQHASEVASCSIVPALGREAISLDGIKTLTLQGNAVLPEGVDVIPVSGLPGPLPLTPSQSVDDVMPPLFVRSSMNNRRHYVVRFAQGRVVTSNYGYAVYDKHDHYVTDFCANDGVLLAIAEEGMLPEPRKIEGAVLCMAHVWGFAMFHWILENVPRIKLFEMAGIDLGKVDHILLRDFSPLHQETFQLLGIPAEKVILVRDYPHLVADELYVTSNVENYDFRFSPNFIEIEHWICDYLRNSMKSSQSVDEAAKRRIYITRAKANWRNLVNEAEVDFALQQYGFETFAFEELTLSDKIKILSEAEIVVSPAGGGLTQLPFCRPGTKVVVFYAEHCAGAEYWSLATQAGLEHYHLLCPGAKKFFPQSYSNRNFATSDLLVEIDKLKRTLEMAGVYPVS